MGIRLKISRQAERVLRFVLARVASVKVLVVIFRHRYLKTQHLVDLIRDLPDYPASMMTPNASITITLECASITPKLLANLAPTSQKSLANRSSISNLSMESDEIEIANLLSRTFTSEGSDKATTHDYHIVYAQSIYNLLRNRENIKIFEIGLGSNDPLIPSTMGFFGTPGASIKAWAKLPFVESVTGADIDKKILFTTDRIETFQLNQIDQQSWDMHSEYLRRRGPFDLIIDDGLHAFAANMMVISNCLELLTPGGEIIIEDVSDSSLTLWATAQELAREKFSIRGLKGKAANCFVIKKNAN